MSTLTTPPLPRRKSFGDIGALLARKKKKQQQQQQEKEKETYEVILSPQSGNPNSSWRVFLDGAILYVLCLGLPTMFGVGMHFYEGHDFWGQFQHWNRSLYHNMSMNLCHKQWTWWCPTVTTAHPGWAPDAEWTDVGVVALLSLSLALIRLLVVHLLVPQYLAEPVRLQALVRCKSVHLLSSAYPVTLTPRSSVSQSPRQGFDAYRSEDMAGIPPPPLLSDDNNLLNLPNLQKKDLGDQPERQNTEPWWRTRLSQLFSIITSIWCTCRRSARRVLGLEARAPYDGEEIKDTDRLFAAPRYATAVFRLLYCAGSCTCALVWFRSADFWPPAVGGVGRTENCWDLKGGVALEALADTDFDRRNAVLRLYFLVQASYHLHSWATHIVSMLVLLFYKKDGSKLVSMRKSMVSYWRSLLQHLLALALIGGCYLFSGLRRLGCIGIFALDFSSVFVHLLQICMNAPENSILRRPNLIIWIHRGLVIPTFIYARFFVFPFVVWYSSVYESRKWLQQMERTLLPGTATAMLLLFHSFLVMLTGLNFILLGRLLKHPHLKRVLQLSSSRPGE